MSELHTGKTQNALFDQGLSFAYTVANRQSCRDFLPTPVPRRVITDLLEDGQKSASNCNTQPWSVHIVSGATRVRLSGALHEAHASGRASSDFLGMTMHSLMYMACAVANRVQYTTQISALREKT